MDTDKIEQRLQQISDILVLNGTLVDCPGLIHGKTGIAIFFFHYAQYTSNVLYENYALDLISEMQTQIHNNSPVDYETGLAGIGVGIDYLLSNRFLEVEDDFFDEFDKRMIRAVMYDSCQDFTLYNGFAGYGQYWIMRQRRQTPLVQAKECLLHIVACMEENFPDFSEQEKTDVHCFLHHLNQLPGFTTGTELMEQCRNPSVNLNQHFPRFDHDVVEKNIMNRMGLLSGYAGEGMVRLTTLNQTNSAWRSLL